MKSARNIATTWTLVLCGIALVSWPLWAYALFTGLAYAGKSDHIVAILTSSTIALIFATTTAIVWHGSQRTKLGAGVLCGAIIAAIVAHLYTPGRTIWFLDLVLLPPLLSAMSTPLSWSRRFQQLTPKTQVRIVVVAFTLITLPIVPPVLFRICN